MKKILAVAALSVVCFQSHAVIAIFRERFAPNTSNGAYVSVWMNQTPVPQNGGPVTFPQGSTVLTVNIDPSSTCPNTDLYPMGFEYEEYSVDGGKTWTIMPETWIVISLPHSCITAAQIVTVSPPLFDEGPMIEQVGCPKGGP